jgi:diaminopimelate decarboxylase
LHLRGTMEVNGQGHLVIGGCDTVELTREFGTPLYVFDEDDIRSRCRAYIRGFGSAYPDSEIIYAGKAFLTTAMCRIVEEEGLSLDVVSGGELYTALAAGYPPERIYFHGNNKSPDEIRLGLQAGVRRFVVDNLYELDLLEEEAGRIGKTAQILLRLAPGVEAHTHTYLRTGQTDSKFGFGIANGRAEEAIRQALEHSHLCLRGLHAHIGSQIFEIESFEAEVEVMVEFMAQLHGTLGVTIHELDLGGGLGIRYRSSDTPPSIAALAVTIARALERECQRWGLALPHLMVEPGRSIVGEAGTTLYTVGAVKDIPGVRTYVAVDGGMADNPRVALYQAAYEAVVANKAGVQSDTLVSVAGKCCESGDMLIWDLSIPAVQPGDILAVFSTGAYNYSMASNYNRLMRPAAVLVHRGTADLIVRRESLRDLVQNDCIPERLSRPLDQAAASEESGNELPGTPARV